MNSDINFELPHGYEFNGLVRFFSLCSFHWKEEWEKFDQLTIEIEAFKNNCGGSFINRYSFTPRRSQDNPPGLTLISSREVFPPPLYE